MSDELLINGNQVYPPGWRGPFPGMMKLERDLWNKFLDRWGARFSGFIYNVRCGNGGEVPEETPRNMREMWQQITSKRADAVGFSPNGTWIFEIKSVVVPGMFGQLITYLHLLPDCFQLPPPVTLTVVTNRLDPDLMEVAKRWKIQYLVP